MNGPIAVPTAVSGRWRPVQGAAHLIALVIGIRGLVMGPVPNEPLSIVTNNSQLLTSLWYISLILGALTAMVGEIKQLRIPFLTTTAEELTNFVEGLIIERAGTALIGTLFMSYALAILIAPDILWTRALQFMLLGLGFVGRTFQIGRDRRKLKSDLQAAQSNANNS